MVEMLVQKWCSLNMEPLSLACWPRKKVVAQRQTVTDPKFLHVVHLHSLGNISAQHHRLGPYCYRILACIKKSPAHTSDGCLGQQQYPSSMDKLWGKNKLYMWNLALVLLYSMIDMVERLGHSCTVIIQKPNWLANPHNSIKGKVW